MTVRKGWGPAGASWARWTQGGGGEGADGVASFRERFTAGAGEMFVQLEGCEERGLVGRDLGGRRVVVERGQGGYEGSHGGSLGVGAEAAAALAELGSEPHS